MSGAEQQALVDLLRNVSKDEQRWEQWMRTFNRYPLHYPALQPALGQALATAPPYALQSYAAAVVLTALGGSGREFVAECLRAFRAEASEEQRRALWTCAFDCWKKWAFGAHEPFGHLTTYGRSELDYAVVGYVVECMTPTARDAALVSIREEMRQLEYVWHGSLSDFISAWNRLLSMFQPYAHASELITARPDWLMGVQFYLPFDPKVNLYTALMMRS